MTYPPQSDEFYMSRALELSRQGLGRVAPNPSVGCVIVKGGKVISEARTSDDGRPHAETLALEKAGSDAKDSVIYVSLEPCAHTGKTQPCAQALIDAEVRKVVVACTDPDDRVNGQGIHMLKAAGIEVAEGILQVEAEELNKGFFLSKTEKRPLITLKVATSLDGKIATQTGHSKWITGEQAREEVHHLRDKHDAILTGSGTILVDDPRMDVRIETDRTQMPLRIVLDRRDRISKTAKIHGKDGRCIIMNDYADLKSLMTELVEQYEITRLMVEAGSTLLSSFIRENLWDELYWFRAPVLIGDEGQGVFSMPEVQEMADAKRMKRISVSEVGDDLLEIYRKEA